MVFFDKRELVVAVKMFPWGYQMCPGSVHCAAE